MLYQMPRPIPIPVPPPLHYLDSAAQLLRLQAQGYPLAELSRMTGLTIPQLRERMRLCKLDEGLQTLLRRENVPEGIAVLLLQLPDPLSRRRMANRIVRERLCIRDAGLLISAAQRNPRLREGPEIHQQHVVTLMRDMRPFRNAICDIVEQMKTAGVRATLTERSTGGMQELTISYPTRRRRTERHQSM